MKHARQFIGVAAAIVCCVVWASAGQSHDVEISSLMDVQPSFLLVSPPGENWPSYNGDYTGRRYSRLAQINVKNVRRLSAQWVFHSRNSNLLETTPVVINGVMFVTSANDAFALDARTGREIWHYSRPITEGLIDDASAHHNRGVAVWHSRVYMETDNAHLLCLDARSGHLIWDVAYADTHKNYGATSAPLIVKDKVLVGTSGGDDGVRGFLAAFDARTGKLLWRFWTIPGPGEFGSSSWPGESYWHGGGTTWMPGTYDPTLNTLYWGTSNPDPDFDGSSRPGDDLYTDCVLALDPDTGKLKWHFQFTPHDLYDYDATETPVLVDTNFHSQPRKLLLHADRNGFFYVLDRLTGELLLAEPFVRNLTWASGIGKDGRPKLLAGYEPTPDGARSCPSVAGATNWPSVAFNPATGLFYLMAEESCNIYSKNDEWWEHGKSFYGGGTRRSPRDVSAKFVRALDIQTGKI